MDQKDICETANRMEIGGPPGKRTKRTEKLALIKVEARPLEKSPTKKSK